MTSKDRNCNITSVVDTESASHINSSASAAFYKIRPQPSTPMIVIPKKGKKAWMNLCPEPKRV
jgi:hypothetical protein